MNSSAPIQPVGKAFTDAPVSKYRPYGWRLGEIKHNIKLYQVDWNAAIANRCGVSHSSRTRLSLSANHIQTADIIATRWCDQTETNIGQDGIIDNSVCFNSLTISEYLPKGEYNKRVVKEELRGRTGRDRVPRLAFANVLVPLKDVEKAREWAERHTNNGVNNSNHDADSILASRAVRGAAYPDREALDDGPNKQAHLRRYLINPALIPWHTLPQTARALGRVSIDGEVIVMEGRLAEWAQCPLPYELGVAGIDELKKWRISPVHVTSILSLKTEKEKPTGNTTLQSALSVCEKVGEGIEPQGVSELLTPLAGQKQPVSPGRGGAAPVENSVDKAPTPNSAWPLVEAYVGVLMRLNPDRYDAQTLRNSAHRAVQNWDKAMKPHLDGEKATWIAPAIANFERFCIKTKFVPQQLPANFFQYNPYSGIFRAIQMLGQYEQAAAAQQAATEAKITKKHAAKINFTGQAIDRKQGDLLDRDLRKDEDPRNKPFGYIVSKGEGQGEVVSMHLPVGEWITTWILPRLRVMHAGNKHAMHTLNGNADLHGWYDAILEMRRYAEILVQNTTGHAIWTIENHTLSERFVRNALAWWLADPKRADFSTTAPGVSWFANRKLDYEQAAPWRKKFTITGLIRDNATGRPVMDAFFGAFLKALAAPQAGGKKAPLLNHWSLSEAKKRENDGADSLAKYVYHLQKTCGLAIYYTPVDAASGETLGFIMLSSIEIFDRKRKALAEPGRYPKIEYHLEKMEQWKGEIPTV